MRTKYVDLLQKEFNFKMLKPGKNKYKLKRVTASSNISMGYWCFPNKKILRNSPCLPACKQKNIATRLRDTT